MKIFAKLFASAFAISSALTMGAAEPANYYNSCEGYYGANLLSRLQKVVGNHNVVSYDGLWELYKSSDVRANGTIWDMYSTAIYYPGQKQCGNYSKVGDCYNREHSMPKSWFNNAKPMYSDAFHLYPTDGKVNGQRSDYPYGECAQGTTLTGSGSVKALGRLGKSTFSGYSGTVFEPDDEYKGDFARSYFYMAAAYNDKIAGWDSDMLAGNAYPAFSSWAVDLLLKWHRQDPVSKKELDRNEAVAKAQNNRNPFIDHPELAEYIWGDKKSERWYLADPEPSIILPVNNSSVNVGTTMTGVSRTATITIKAQNLEEDVYLSVTGSGFSVSPTVLYATAVQTDNGSTATITFKPSSAGTFTGTLTVESSSLISTVKLTGTAVDNIPVGPVTGVSDDSFEAVWSYIGDANSSGNYTLNVMLAGTSISGYPKAVKASDERYVVENLDASTTYTYTVSSQSHTSKAVTVTTLDPIPSVDVLFDGELNFNAEVGAASEIAELLVFIDNIDTDVKFQVNAPFQLSTDKANWSTTVVLDPEADRLYMRMLSSEQGVFSGSLVITAGDYRNDNITFIGTAGSAYSFLEDFEAGTRETYNNGEYRGTACRWNFTNAGVWNNKDAYEGHLAARFGDLPTSAIEMLEDTPAGISTVSFWARTWSASDGESAVYLQYSTDGGRTWKDAGTATMPTTTYKQYTFTLKTTEPTRLRVKQYSGKRLLIDNIEATPYTATAELIPDDVADYHSWDAFCRGGKLVIEAADSTFVSVYSLDGAEVFMGSIASGETVLNVAPGLYIVAVDNFGRRVLVK